ncbi:LTA synthase family protein [Sulfuricaulis sp.]|jgi:phosphoglycerol transferase MdoB-like AlkP superfamily enzyme|uniref:LTA synthase family protein n=1 Tax=Sulfuricaulis sp. TaxID=2003553 RepID=UPI0035594909
MKDTPLTLLRKSLLYFGLALALFSLFRVALFVVYRDYFGQLSAGETLWAFVHGVRFDAATLAVFFFIPLLLMNLPLKFAVSRWWHQPLAWILWAMTVVMGVVLAADLVYFGFVNRHIATELIAVGNDMGPMLHIAFTGYLGAVLAYLALCAGLALLWWRIAARETVASHQSVMRFAVLFIVLILAGRGWTFYGKPINVVHAFTSGSTAAGNLTLNGVYSAAQTSYSSRVVNHRFFDAAEARRLTAEAYPLADGEYPMQRRYAPQPKHSNLVIVLLESWSFHYVDALAGGHFGATPNFDALVLQSLCFTRAYSEGQRSIEGVQATLTGIPLLIGMPYLGKGLEVTNVSRLGAIAQRHGYRTIFVQSSHRGSFRMDAIARAAGFEEYYGMEDIPVVLDYPDANASPFGWDYDTFMFLSGKLAQTQGPFLAYVYTGTTHEPFTRLPARFEKRPHGELTEDGFLNTLYYADWSLGEFMKKAAQADWFKDTVFVFVADHPIGKFGVSKVLDRFHIPILIYAPGRVKPGTNDVVASQLDLFPTVIDLLGFDDPVSALGDSLLRKRDGYAFVSAGNVVGMIGKEGFLTHSLKNRLDSGVTAGAPPAYLDALEKKLLATDQVVYELLQSNRWAPP